MLQILFYMITVGMWWW